MIQQKKSSLFPYILSLSLLFFVWQILFSLLSGTNNAIVSIILRGSIQIPINIIWPNLFYFAVQLILYVFFATVIWAIARLASLRLNLSWEKTTKVGLYLFVFFAAWVLLANQIHFPLSRFSIGILNEYISLIIIKILFILCSIIIVGFFFLALIQLFIEMFLRSKKKILYTTISLALLLLLFAFVFYYRTKPPVIHPSKKPNVFIIGIDALRPDHVGYYNSTEKNTPNLDRFLSQSTNFTFSLTPLARTFPSWVSILTGQYPKHNKARYNLTDLKYLVLKNTLPELLRQNGYNTIYATDEERFSNITIPFGFNQIIGPKIGANDFLLGSFNDFPLSNLFINTKLGSLLYPYSYGNRAAYTVYDPNSFNQMVKDRLQLVSRKPLFLSIHFCLTHWPYIWGNEKFHSYQDNNQYYETAEKRVDKQFEDFVQFLQKNHLLDNAIVVVISDHGEALGIPGDRLLSKEKYVGPIKNTSGLFKNLSTTESLGKNSLNISYGHGTDVLSPCQYHTVLAFRFFGNQKNVIANYAELTSLMDIKPTILNALHLQSPNTDGISLLPSIQKKLKPTPSRMLFVETEFTPTSINSAEISVTNAIFQSIDFFGIDFMDNHIYIKPKAMFFILHAKQRAVYYKNWILAYYPLQNKKELPVFVNTTTGKWTTNLNDTFAKQSPAYNMQNAIKKFYGREIN